MLRKIPLKAGILGPKTAIFAFFHTFLALFGRLYGLFGPFLTLFDKKKTTYILVLLGKKAEKLKKLSGHSVEGGRGYPPFPLRVFWKNYFTLRG